METLSVQLLQQKWESYRQENPDLRIYDASKNLKVSEEQLLVIDPHSSVTPLTSNYPKLFAELDKFGRLMALTRNQSCVIETYGQYHDVRFFGSMGMALNEGIDLRMFLDNWGHTYAVETRAKGRTRKSIQIFSKYGEAIHKIYTTAPQQDEVFDQLKDILADSRDIMSLKLSPKEHSSQKYPSADTAILEKDWEALKDTHDFHKMLKNHHISRIDAMHAMEGLFTHKISNESIETLLQDLTRSPINFICFVGNSEMIQIFTGQTKTFKKLGTWLNFLDPEFNLHLNRSDIHECFVVKKPSVDGIITSVEIYDKRGGLICQFFGARKPGQGELTLWRDLTTKLKV